MFVTKVALLCTTCIVVLQWRWPEKMKPDPLKMQHGHTFHFFFPPCQDYGCENANIAPEIQLKSSQPPYTSVENNPRVSLSDGSGIGTGLARQPVSLSQAGSRSWLKMASPRESQQLAFTLTVCLHQSTCVCWPSNMMSLLISCIPLNGVQRGALSSQ